MEGIESNERKLCRACLLQPDGEWYSMDCYTTVIDPVASGFDQKRVLRSLHQIYIDCTSINFRDEPQWKWICHICVDKLVDFYEFQLTCQNSYKRLLDTKSRSPSTSERNYANLERDEAPEIVTVKSDIKSEESLPAEDIDFIDFHAPDFDDNDSNSSNDENSDEEKTAIDLDQTKEENSGGDQMETKEKRETLTCDLCQKKFFMKHRFEAHMRKHKGLKQWKCEHCTKEFKKYSSMKDHVAAHHLVQTEEFKCEVEGCEKTYKVKSSLQSHVKTIHKEKKKPTKEKDVDGINDSSYKCELCGKKFNKQHRYDGHMRKHQGLKQWQCEHCEKGFNKYASLKTHIETYHFDAASGQPEYICDDCGKIYVQKDSLRAHILKIHIRKESAPIACKICDQCGKTFKNNAALTKHTYTHTKITPFKCDRCSKMFATRWKLKEHVMRHEGIKNHVCPVCGLRKTTGHELRYHMKFHTTTAEFPCELCSAMFTREANRKRHMKVVHCGVKAYPCPHCDRSFGKAETRKHHVMTHTGEKPHECPYCLKRFIQAVALKTHLRVHNKKQTIGPVQ